jgi:hypothetical protein
MMRFNEIILCRYEWLMYNDMIYAQDLKVQLKVICIFWIRIEVLLKLIFKGIYQG